MTKCKHYSVLAWAEPPLEPDENGTLHSEGRCDKGVILNEVHCGGNKEICDIDPEIDPEYEAMRQNSIPVDPE